MLYKYSLVYICFILSSKNMVPLFCCQFRGRYSGKFTHGTSVLCEIGEAIEKISTFRFFLNLLYLFFGPYIFIKQIKKWGSTVLFPS